MLYVVCIVQGGVNGTSIRTEPELQDRLDAGMTVAGELHLAMPPRAHAF